MKAHYVPECYLKQFLSSKNELVTLDLQLYNNHGKFREKGRAAGSICYIEDYYKIKEKVAPDSFFRELNELDPEFVETKAFSEFELNFKAKYDMLTGPKNNLDIHFWTKSIISLKKRNPYYMEMQDFDSLKLSATENLRKSFQSITNDEKAFESLDHLVEKIEQEIDAQRKFNLTSLIHDAQRTETESDAEETIKSLQWDILVADTKYPFTTTDNPGFAIASDGEFNSFKFLDEYRKVRFYMPLSPTHCLRITSIPNKIYTGKTKTAGIVNLSKYETFALNLAGMKFAKRYCISNTPGFFNQMQKEIISLFNFRNQLEMFGFPYFLQQL